MIVWFNVYSCFFWTWSSVSLITLHVCGSQENTQFRDPVAGQQPGQRSSTVKISIMLSTVGKAETRTPCTWIDWGKYPRSRGKKIQNWNYRALTRPDFFCASQAEKASNSRVSEGALIPRGLVEEVPTFPHETKEATQPTQIIHNSFL